ncbi:MAG: hypothetical protein KA896_15735 [Leptothrix sp. (in: Bacteria)]|jgi:hypothetical protein|nr:hypothetical protein [Leptothrix sp. (in: b-proteobacteria)]
MSFTEFAVLITIGTAALLGFTGNLLRDSGRQQERHEKLLCASTERQIIQTQQQEFRYFKLNCVIRKYGQIEISIGTAFLFICQIY